MENNNIRLIKVNRKNFNALIDLEVNQVAKKLYASFGFEENPAFYGEGDEMPAVLRL